jgi:hypothetical protein
MRKINKGETMARWIEALLGSVAVSALLIYLVGIPGYVTGYWSSYTECQKAELAAAKKGKDFDCRSIGANTK